MQVRPELKPEVLKVNLGCYVSTRIFIAHHVIIVRYVVKPRHGVFFHVHVYIQRLLRFCEIGREKHIFYVRSEHVDSEYFQISDVIIIKTWSSKVSLNDGETDSQTERVISKRRTNGDG